MIVSRWLQALMYLGLTFAPFLYCYRLLLNLWHIFREINHLEEEDLMIAVLSLVDVTIVSNLVYMFVVGGYSNFVSRISIETHSDRRNGSKRPTPRR